MALNPLERFGRGLASWWSRIKAPAPSKRVIPEPEPPPNPRSPVFGDPDQDYTDDEVVEHIKDLVGNFPEFNLKTVRKNVPKMDGMERWMVMRMDLDAFRRMASVNPLFWYH